jgi:hypothetical protein
MVRQVSQTTVVDWSLCNSILDKSIKPPKASADTGLGEEMKFAVRATMLSSSRQGIEYRFPNRRSPSSPELDNRINEASMRCPLRRTAAADVGRKAAAIRPATSAPRACFG